MSKLKTEVFYNGEPVERESVRAYEVVGEILASAAETVRGATTLMPEALRRDYDEALRALRKVERLSSRSRQIAGDHARQMRAGVPTDEALQTALSEDHWRRGRRGLDHETTNVEAAAAFERDRNA